MSPYDDITVVYSPEAMAVSNHFANIEADAYERPAPRKMTPMPASFPKATAVLTMAGIALPNLYPNRSVTRTKGKETE